MNKWIPISLLVFGGIFLLTTAQAADVVPPEIQMPGTQPNEVGNFESPDKCDNCHAGYNDLDPGAEPATGWRGGAMGNAGRDPVFWATLAVAEQDFDGAGDLCIRCHSAGGWYGGRSTPTDGSGLANSDDNGIDCDTCHASTNTDNNGINPSTGGSLAGVMISPFIANCDPDPNVPDKCSSTGEPGEGFYGSGMLSLFPSVNVKLGPFSDAEARHQWEQSAWHRSPDFCGTCHDVSNPAVGDLAPGNGAQHGAPHVVSSQDFNDGAPNLGGPVEEKAAFNNPPYAYGIVERTFSEYKSSPLSSTRVGDFTSLPEDLQAPGGSLEVTYLASLAADPAPSPDGTPGDYADGTPRTFSCQSCHMRPVGVNPDTGEAYPGCNKNGVPLRPDLPRHDHTGGNYWFASMAQYQDAAGTLRLGGGLNGTQLLAMDLGQERATKHLREAGALEVSGNSVKVTNLTGHKLITGYPEGRRMWLRIEWRDSDGTVLQTDGEYGTLTVDLDQDGQVDDSVESILDLQGANTKIYEAHYAVTQEWAATLMAVNATYYGPIVLDYDRITGAPGTTIAQLAAMPAGSHVDTFHFAINNYVSKDNRIPPYQMSYDEAKKRNALPVPDTQYGDPGAGGVYEHWDTVALNPPAGAASATIELLYQGTSWEYIQFLQLANNGQNAFLGGEGDAMMDAWLNADVIKSNGNPITGVLQVNGDYKMVPPVVMATATWGAQPGNQAPVAVADSYFVDQDSTLNVDAASGILSNDTDDGLIAPLVAQLVNNPSSGTLTLSVDGSFVYTPNAGFTGNDSFDYQAYDGELTSAPPTTQVSITVNPAGGNNPPVPSDDSYSTPQDTPLSVAAPGVLGNDSDPDGDPLTAVQLSSPANGNATLNADGSLEYTPNAGFTGDDSFTYQAEDGNGGVATATVTISITGACSDHGSKSACNNDPACEWTGSPKNGSCQEAAACNVTEDPEVSCTDGIDNDCDGLTDGADPDCGAPPADCSLIGDKTSCNAEATCRWDNRSKSCISN
ncbi:MAG: Ig-like domain-containing protein [Gammaproteobacteria bacterium]|jgi:hypothetical protein